MAKPSLPTSPRARALLASSALFGLAYLGHGLGFAAPYPLSAIIKAAGIVLLGLLAFDRRAPLLGLGLLLGALGDVFLALEPPQVALGIGAFGLGHIIYLALFAKLWRSEGARGGVGWVAALALACFGLAMLVYLQPHFGALRVPASIYNGIIIVMACLALVGRSPTFAWAGALLFVASDSLLAMRMFAGQLDWAGPLVWLTYYLGQAGLALGLSGAPQEPS